MNGFINIAKDHLATAVLNTTEGLYVYYADEINGYCIVSLEDLEDLGRRLASGDVEAYSRWAAETDTIIFDDDETKLTQIGDEFEKDGVITRYFESKHGVQVMIHLRPNSTRLVEAEGYDDGEAEFYVSQLLAEMLNELDQDDLAEKAGFYNEE